MRVESKQLAFKINPICFTVFQVFNLNYFYFFFGCYFRYCNTCTHTHTHIYEWIMWLIIRTCLMHVLLNLMLFPFHMKFCTVKFLGDCDHVFRSEGPMYAYMWSFKDLRLGSTDIFYKTKRSVTIIIKHDND